jgi:hypothetical protein
MLNLAQWTLFPAEILIEPKFIGTLWTLISGKIQYGYVGHPKIGDDQEEEGP